VKGEPDRYRIYDNYSLLYAISRLRHGVNGLGLVPKCGKPSPTNCGGGHPHTFLCKPCGWSNDCWVKKSLHEAVMPGMAPRVPLRLTRNLRGYPGTLLGWLRDLAVLRSLKTGLSRLWPGRNAHGGAPTFVKASNESQGPSGHRSCADRQLVHGHRLRWRNYAPARVAVNITAPVKASELICGLPNALPQRLDGAAVGARERPRLVTRGRGTLSPPRGKAAGEGALLSETYARVPRLTGSDTESLSYFAEIKAASVDAVSCPECNPPVQQIARDTIHPFPPE
jgi:hypothetical protein